MSQYEPKYNKSTSYIAGFGALSLGVFALSNPVLLFGGLIGLGVASATKPEATSRFINKIRSDLSPLFSDIRHYAKKDWVSFKGWLGLRGPAGVSAQSEESTREEGVASKGVLKDAEAGAAFGAAATRDADVRVGGSKPAADNSPKFN